MNCEQYTMIDLETFHDKEWYLRIVDFIRVRNSNHAEVSGGWPGNPKGSPAVSQYPNLAAELTAPGFFTYIGNVAKTAGVRPQTIASAIECGANLRPYQLERLASALNVSVEYLSDPHIAAIDPATAVGALQTARLGSLLEDVKGLVVPMIDWMREDYEKLGGTCITLYVSYRSDIRILLTAKHHPIPNGRKPSDENTALRIDGHTSSWGAIEA